MRGVLLLALCFLTLSHTPATAQETGPLFSGAYLRDLCKRGPLGGETVKGAHTACQAYIAGVVDYHDLLRSLGTAPSVDFCVPNTVKMNDLQDLLYKYLEKNTQHNAFSASPAVALALFEKYPCPAKKKKR
jgi:hypothetical protein